MKRKKHSDEELQSMLKNLPPIEDRQSKEDLYREISPRIHKQKRKVAPWVMPGVATLAVVLLLAVMIPMFLSSINSNQFSESADQGESSEEATIENSESSSSEEKSATLQNDDQQSATEDSATSSEETAEAPESEAAPSAPADNITPHTVHQLDEQMTTLVLTGRQGQVVVPVTLIPEGDVNPGDLAQLVQPDSLGLGENVISDLSFSVNEQEQQATVTFPNDFSVSGEAWANMILESIRWTLEGEELQSIQLRTEDGSPVSLGAYGPKEELTPVGKENYAYQIYQQPGKERQFLVPVQVEGDLSIKEALDEMKNVPDTLKLVKPSVPDHVKFSAVEEDGESLSIEVEHGPWSDEQQQIRMIEATLLTAKQFGYQQVSFENMESDQSGYYDLQQPIRVPDSINPINIQP